MENNKAIIYFGTLNGENDLDKRLDLCSKYANEHNYNIVKDTGDFVDLVNFVTTNPNHTVIVPSYYNFAEDPRDIGFMVFFEKYNTTVVSATEILDECLDLKAFYHHYKKGVFGDGDLKGKHEVHLIRKGGWTIGMYDEE